MGKTHIEIKEERRDALRVYKAKEGLTYDEAIAKLLAEVERQ